MSTTDLEDRILIIGIEKTSRCIAAKSNYAPRSWICRYIKLELFNDLFTYPIHNLTPHIRYAESKPTSETKHICSQMKLQRGMYQVHVSKTYLNLIPNKKQEMVLWECHWTRLHYLSAITQFWVVQQRFALHKVLITIWITTKQVSSKLQNDII